MRNRRQSGSGLVRLGDLLPKAQIPQFDEWMRRTAAHDGAKPPPRPKKQSPQLELNFESPR